MKQIHNEKLASDLVKYCKQIGVLDNEIPRLIFDSKQYTEIVKSRDSDYNRRMHNDNLGQCDYATRSLFVNGNSRGSYHEYEYNEKGKKIKKIINGEAYYKLVRKKTNYNSYKDTLVHELVHYRFHNMDHGPRFIRRIKEIMRGQTFPLEHLHLFNSLPEGLKMPTTGVNKK